MVKRITITMRDWLFKEVERAKKKQSRSEFIETILSKHFIGKNKRK